MHGLKRPVIWTALTGRARFGLRLTLKQCCAEPYSRWRSWQGLSRHRPLPHQPISIEKTIQPILSANCLACHNSKVKQGGLDLSTRDALLKGSEHGKVVVLGNSNDSVLYKVVAHITEPGMPFKGKKLPDASIAAISEWIKAGVPYGDAAERRGQRRR